MKVGTIFITKFLITVIVTLVILIIIKSSTGFKNTFYKQVYGTNISFTELKKLYNKYIGDSSILDSVVKDEAVFSEKLTYSKTEKYLDGVNLNVTTNYLVPIEL